MKSGGDDAGYVALRSPRPAEQQRDGAHNKVVSETEVSAISQSTNNAGDEAKKHSPSSSPDQSPAAPVPPVSLLGLYRFATPRDRVLVAIACIVACINGILQPSMALVFGHAIAAFDPFNSSAVNRAALEFFLISLALFLTDFLLFALFGATAERQIKRLREAALRHLLHMDISWYDAQSNQVLQFSTRITGDTIKIKNGMGQKLGESINYTAQFVAGYLIGFVQSWDMALVMCCATPFTVWSLTYLLTMLRTWSTRSQKLYAEAGAIAEETLSSIRTVAALNGEKKAIAKYDDKTHAVEQENIRFFLRASMVQGVFTSSVWLMYAAGLWYGGWKVYSSQLPPSTVFQAFFGVVLGTRSLGQISPSVSAVAEARGAAAALFEILDTKPSIDAASNEGERPANCQGHVVLEDVHFAYPTRTDVPVLQGMSVSIAAGETVAFVGSSGGGKSTIVSLLERFYDPDSGRVLLDGTDLRTLNVQWLRSQIGLVSQEPVLFAGSVYENIVAGCVHTSVSMDDVVAAAKLAHAHDFIMGLPQQYDTYVGEKGVSLSGGQKQRVAIARALVRKPKILVLDEATSALDNESERVVQAALNNLIQQQTQMTRIVIAHRLSTIRDADKIVVVAGGRVVEQGTHEELVQLNGGLYKELYTTQTLGVDDPSTLAAEETAPVTDTLEPTNEAAVKASSPASETTASSSSDSTSKKEQTKFTLGEAMRLSVPERGYFAVGMVAAAVHGLALPTSALLVSDVIAEMTAQFAVFLRTQDTGVLRDLSDTVQGYGQWYLAGAAVVCAAHATQVYTFRFMAERLTARLRHLHFESLCRQDIAFFDDPKHATGSLTSSLAVQSLKVSLVSGDSQGRLMQSGSTLTAAILISFIAGSWVLTLIMLAIFPFLAWGEVMRFKLIKGSQLFTDELSDAGATASQALNNVRTVAALGVQHKMVDEFGSKLEEPQRIGVKEARVSGVAAGFSSFIVFATYAVVFWYGGVLVNKDSITFKQLMRTLMAILMSSQGIGYAIAWVGESAHAMQAGESIFNVRDRPHMIDALRDDEGEELRAVEGRIEFQDVVFRYPTRPDVTVLDGFNLTIGAKQTVGFCGTSGGGKSTIVALLERFYDPVNGQVLLDGHDIRTLNVSWLRRQIGYVGQEPTLFIGSIADNIAYGLEHPVSHEEIERVAKLANAHEFITNMPDGYATQVGAKGELLSGGQKQRIAIARAILRNPRVLILDEATSALDSTSERVVQAALDSVVAAQRCTTLIIAHRLSTLRHADKICVMDHGRIVEQGPHAELLSVGGAYAKLLQSSSHDG